MALRAHIALITSGVSPKLLNNSRQTSSAETASANIPRLRDLRARDATLTVRFTTQSYFFLTNVRALVGTCTDHLAGL
jgi:hypothetical protein